MPRTSYRKGRHFAHPAQTSALILRPGERVTPDWRPDELPSLDGVIELAYDHETTGLAWMPPKRDYVVGTAIAYRRPGDKTITSHYFGIRHEGGGNIPEERWREWHQRELRGKRLVTANGKYDVHVSINTDLDLEACGAEITDVQHSAALLDDYRREFSLEVLAQHYLGAGKAEYGIDKSRMKHYHVADVEEYAKMDAQRTLELRECFLRMLRQEDLLEVQKIEDDCIYPTVEMEGNGALLDEELLDQWVIEAEQDMLRLISEIHDEAGVRIEVSAPKDIEFLFERLGLQVPPSFAADVLKSYEHPTIKKLHAARQIWSLSTKFLLKYQSEVKKWGRLYYGLNQLKSDNEGDSKGTVSGRYSSSGIQIVPPPNKVVVGVNIQQVSNVKKQIARYGNKKYLIRKLFKPAPGKLWLSSDARQIEYRIFAHYANNAAIIRAYEEDPYVDFHMRVKNMLDSVRVLTRDRTKDVNFALIYGAGIEKMTRMVLGIPDSVRVTPAQIRELEAIREAYFQMMPEVPRLLKHASHLAKTRGYVRTVTGRRARFVDGQFAHAAFNRVDQGSGADINKRKVREVYDERKRLGLTMRISLHDELDADCPDEESMREVAKILDRQTTPMKVPILWDTHVGPTWADAK